ncbi:hypothetical protein T492DRAFT_1036184 [Pavlovales sp. CCMP2436]|nr:hypothetical protein T492DRAFT_1036184 [Pavlovales sp. CCMP2436]
MAIHACAACRSILFGRDFIGAGAGELDAALRWHLRGECTAVSLEEEVHAALLRGAAGGGAEMRPLGESPLVFLARQGSEKVALLALSQDVDVDVRDHFGVTPLHHAASRGALALVLALLEKGASVKSRTGDSLHSHVGGCTPLHLVAAFPRPATAAVIVSALLAARADSSTENVDGLTAAEVGRRHGGDARGALCALFDGFDKGADGRAAVDQALERACARDRQRLRLDISARPPLQVVHVLRGLLGAEACRRLRESVLAMARSRGWQSARHAHHPTVDLPLWRVPDARAIVDSLFRERVLPEMARAFEVGPGYELRLREAFFVQYCAEPAVSCSTLPSVAVSGAGRGARAGLGLHRDGTLLSCNVLLNAPSEFEGGGTYFAAEDRTVSAGSGDCVIHCGQLLHGASPVLRGTRLVLVAFIDEVDCELEHED